MYRSVSRLERTPHTNQRHSKDIANKGYYTHLGERARERSQYLEELCWLDIEWHSIGVFCRNRTDRYGDGRLIRLSSGSGCSWLGDGLIWCSRRHCVSSESYIVFSRLESRYASDFFLVTGGLRRCALTEDSELASGR